MIKTTPLTLRDIVHGKQSHRGLRNKPLVSIFERTIKKKRKLSKRSDKEYANDIASDVTFLFWKFLLNDLLDNKGSFVLPYNTFRLKVVSDKKTNLPFCMFIHNTKIVRMKTNAYMMFEGDLLEKAFWKKEDGERFTFDQFDLNFY